MEPRNLNSVYVPLRLCYGLVPVAAGLDKFTNLLVDWTVYLPRFVADGLPVEAHVFMRAVGVIEIVAGLVVLLWLPRLGGLVVMAWLALVGLMAALAGHPDILVRDLVMALGAYTLSVVAGLRGEPLVPGGPVRTGAQPHAVGR